MNTTKETHSKFRNWVISIYFIYNWLQYKICFNFSATWVFKEGRCIGIRYQALIANHSVTESIWMESERYLNRITNGQVEQKPVSRLSNWMPTKTNLIKSRKIKKASQRRKELAERKKSKRSNLEYNGENFLRTKFTLQQKMWDVKYLS